MCQFYVPKCRPTMMAFLANSPNISALINKADGVLFGTLIIIVDESNCRDAADVGMAGRCQFGSAPRGDN